MGGWTWVQFPEAMLRGEGRSQPCVPPVPGIQHAFLASVGTRHACGVRAYTLAKHPHTLICKRGSTEQALAQALSTNGAAHVQDGVGSPPPQVTHFRQFLTS